MLIFVNVERTLIAVAAVSREFRVSIKELLELLKVEVATAWLVELHSC
jgi:hypothetical protein